MRGVVHVAEVCARRGTRLVFVSTDYVFDGSKRAPYEADDPLCPTSGYRRSKEPAETAVRARAMRS